MPSITPRLAPESRPDNCLEGLCFSTNEQPYETLSDDKRALVDEYVESADVYGYSHCQVGGCFGSCHIEIWKHPDEATTVEYMGDALLAECLYGELLK